MNNIDKDKIPVGHAEDLTGKKFNNLTVLYRVKNTGTTTGAKWRCQCDCENHTIIDVLASNLKSGHTKSCGCVQKQAASEKHTDLSIIGKRFGKLVVLEKGAPYIYPSGKKTRIRWKCQCDCGNIVEVDGQSLKRGATKSCGCLHKELNSVNFSEDLTGKCFALLTVLYRKGSTPQGNAIWHCKCKCGKECDVSANHLKAGDTKSCGCLMSQGANKIRQLLIDYNIPFETEKTFETCRFPDTKRLARFDFWVNNQYIIEYDGEQHFTYTNNGWNTEEKYKKTKEHDEIKNNWCKENNIPLIRIPYYKLSTITIQDLLIELTNERQG